MLDAGLYLAELNPQFADAVANWLIPWCAYLGLSGQIVSGYRDNAEQDRLYRLGRSQFQYASRTRMRGAQGTVTDAPAGYSAHNYGLAIDVEGPDQAQILEVARQLGFGLVSWDPAHVEHPQFATFLKQLPPLS
jgi:hypothetical protein